MLKTYLTEAIAFQETSGYSSRRLQTARAETDTTRDERRVGGRGAGICNAFHGLVKECSFS